MVELYVGFAIGFITAAIIFARTYKRFCKCKHGMSCEETWAWLEKVIDRESVLAHSNFDLRIKNNLLTAEILGLKAGREITDNGKGEWTVTCGAPLNDA